jgi:hypothetical protein
MRARLPHHARGESLLRQRGASLSTRPDVSTWWGARLIAPVFSQSPEKLQPRVECGHKTAVQKY